MTKKNGIATQLGVLFISVMLTSSQAINGIIPQMKAALQISQGQSELLGTAPSVTVVLFILLSSRIAKKIGMKNTVLTGLVIAGIGGFLPVFSAQFSLILMSRILLGAGLGLYNSIAVSYISSLYTGDKRATLLVIRNSMEAIGQTILLFLAGVLLNYNWKFAFIVYILALPIALFFYLTVPEVENTSEQTTKAREKMSPVVYGLVVFAILLVMNSIAISVRFASIATRIQGVNFSASNYLALMPILGILAGFAFGYVNKKLEYRTLYIGIACFIFSNLFIAISGSSMVLLLSGLFLSSIPGAWCFPFIFSNLDQVTTRNTVNFATSLIFIGCNIGNFIAPLIMRFTQILTGTTSPTAPFFIFALLFVIVYFIVLFLFNKKSAKVSKIQ